jgi:hypothetical protein
MERLCECTVKEKRGKEKEKGKRKEGKKWQ